MAVNKDVLLLVKSSVIGDGEPDLGAKLMDSFFNMLIETDNFPARIVCMSTAIFLTTKGSTVIDKLKILENAGAEIYSCGTCLDYYGRSESLLVGRPTNMKDTVEAMIEFPKVITV